MFAITGRSSGRWFWLAVAVSLAVSVTPWATPLLYPFKVFTTWAHECGHALMAVLVGGRVTAITIAPDTSGVTHSVLPSGRVPRALVASSGYMSAAVVGCLLLAAPRMERRAHAVLLGVGVFMLLTLVFWIRNVFGMVAVLAWGVALVTIARLKGMGDAPRFVLSLLAIQVALNAVYDIRILFQIDRGPSDAATMAQLFLLPSWFWAAAWMMASVAMLAATLRASRLR